MKNFKQHIKEASKTTNDGAVIETEMGALADLSLDTTIEKLNAFVGAVSMKEYLVPDHAIQEMKKQLMKFGIEFGDVEFTTESGEMSLPITQRGGMFGKSGDTPYDEFDDVKESGRSINFVWERTSGGTHRILANIS